MKVSSLRKLAATAAMAGAGLFAAAPASAVIVGGVDFGNFGNHIETTTIAETLITGDGQVLNGYGVINTVNGDNTYAVNPNFQLFFTFTGYTSSNFVAGPGGGVDFTGGTVNVYLGQTFNLLTQSSAANIATIQSYGLWLTLAGHAQNGTPYTLNADGSLTGATISFTGEGLLDVIGGLADVVALLNANTISDGAGGFADIAITTSGNNRVLNPNDICTGQAGQWCIAGSADLRGDLQRVPEPVSIALLGIGLIGLGVTSRKRRVA
jgi:hypothetical protein